MYSCLEYQHSSMINYNLEKLFFRFKNFDGEADNANLFQLLMKRMESDRFQSFLERRNAMASSETWVVYGPQGQQVKTFTGTQSMLAAQNYARMIGGTAHCTG